jgi:hypothetical protein
MTPGDLALAVSHIVSDWQDGGLRAPLPASASTAAACCIEGCDAMTFVELKTQAGRRSLCFKHYQSVDQKQRSTATP